MANWFDENNLTPKEEPEKDDNRFPKDQKTDAEFSGEESNEPAKTAEVSSESENSGWRASDDFRQDQPNSSQIPPVPPVQSPWNTPDGSDRQQSSDPTTYHYGVNAQNPVPNSTNNYYQPTQQNNQNGEYNAQGGFHQPQSYDPYGNWQRIPPQPDMNQNGQPNRPPKPPKKKKNAAAIAIATLSVVCAGAIITLSVLLAVALSNNGIDKQDSGSKSTTSNVNKNAPVLELEKDNPDAQGFTTRSIVEKNLGSTVVITIYSRQSSFYGVPQPQEVGAASGIVMSADGYIITNWHVVVNESTGDPFDRIDVKTHDGTVYENAEVIGADKDTDLAVIKVGAVNLSVPEFGDSSALKLGDKVVAIGNAGGLSWTTTQGIVSGLARDVYEDTGYAIKCLQIDAAINPGNSGGPLLNAQGQVIGINSAKIAAAGYEGLGFSIPIKEAKAIVDDLVKYGYVKNRVMLGVTVRDITQPGYEGVQILEISENSSLAGTNARVGDIITKINNATIQSGVELRSELSKLKVGDKCTLALTRVDRNGGKDTFTVTCTLKEFGG